MSAKPYSPTPQLTTQQQKSFATQLARLAAFIRYHRDVDADDAYNGAMHRSPCARVLLPLSALLGCVTLAATAEVEPHKIARDEFEVDGISCFVDRPHQPAVGRPWVWRARFPGYHTEIDRILLERGFHVAHIDTRGRFGSDGALDHWDNFYAHVTGPKYRLASKVALEGVSRGGLFVYRWAARNPHRVACIYADTPVCDFKSWPLGQGRGLGDAASWRALLKAYELTEAEALQFAHNPLDTLEPIAAARIPILHIVSDNDVVVPPAENTYRLQRRYWELGGHMRVMRVELGTPQSHGHHFEHPDPLTPAEFITNHTIGPHDWMTLRGGLDNCRLKFQRDKQGRVVFLGGSITNMEGWRGLVCSELQRRFPETTFDFVNAGIPSTGSTPGAFRLRRDVFARGPVDLLFEEAAVNDSTNFRSPTEMLRAMEGIVRQARRLNPKIDIGLLHFVDPSKMARYNAGAQPEVITQHERVARHYNLPSINLALEVTQRINAGEFTWEDDFRDLHPSPFGQRLYFDAIKRLFDHAWAEPLSVNASRSDHRLPAPLDPLSYDRGRLVAVSHAELGEGWQLDPSWKPKDQAATRAGFVDVPVVLAMQAGASLTFQFVGSGVGIFVVAGSDAGVVEFRIDDQPWRQQDLFTPWSQSLHIPWAHVLASELADTAHVLTLRVAATKHANSAGHAVRIVNFLVNGPDHN